jgi:hypothetical protein
LPGALATDRWLEYLESLRRFESGYLGRFAHYADSVGNLTKARITDPGEWIEAYSSFLSRVAGDLGDWVLERDGVVLPATDLYVPFYRRKLKRAEGTISIGLRLLRRAFQKEDILLPEVTLRTESFQNLRGGAALPSEHIMFLPGEEPPPKKARAKRVAGSRKRVERRRKLETGPVQLSDPNAQLKIFDVHNWAEKDAVYRGMVWAKETDCVVALVEIEVS